MSIPGDPEGVEIIELGEHEGCPGQLGDLKIPVPDDEDVSLEGVHDAHWICHTCKREISCKVKIDLQRFKGN